MNRFMHNLAYCSNLQCTAAINKKTDPIFVCHEDDCGAGHIWCTAFCRDTDLIHHEIQCFSSPGEPTWTKVDRFMKSALLRVGVSSEYATKNTFQLRHATGIKSDLFLLACAEMCALMMFSPWNRVFGVLQYECNRRAIPFFHYALKRHPFPPADWVRDAFLAFTRFRSGKWIETGDCNEWMKNMQATIQHAEQCVVRIQQWVRRILKAKRLMRWKDDPRVLHWMFRPPDRGGFGYRMAETMFKKTKAKLSSSSSASTSAPVRVKRSSSAPPRADCKRLKKAAVSQLGSLDEDE